MNAQWPQNLGYTLKAAWSCHVCIKKRNGFLRAYIFTVNNCSSWLFSYYYVKNVQCKIFIPKIPLQRDRTGSSAWELLMCCHKLSRLIMMSLKWPSDTTAAQIGHCTNNGFRSKSADPYTFLTFALLSKNFLSSQAVKSFLSWSGSSSGHAESATLEVC